MVCCVEVDLPGGHGTRCYGSRLSATEFTLPAIQAWHVQLMGLSLREKCAKQSFENGRSQAELGNEKIAIDGDEPNQMWLHVVLRVFIGEENVSGNLCSGVHANDIA